MYPPVELGPLSAGERDAVRLVYFEHFTLDQAARALGTDPVGLGRWLSRAYAAVAAQVLASEPTARRMAEPGTSTGDARRHVPSAGPGRHHRATA